jgi:hypothetical protein
MKNAAKLSANWTPAPIVPAEPEEAPDPAAPAAASAELAGHIAAVNKAIVRNLRPMIFMRTLLQLDQPAEASQVPELTRSPGIKPNLPMLLANCGYPIVSPDRTHPGL